MTNCQDKKTLSVVIVTTEKNTYSYFRRMRFKEILPSSGVPSNPQKVLQLKKSKRTSIALIS